MKFQDFEEVNSDEYAVHSGERICYWDETHTQHFFIKKEIILYDEPQDELKKIQQAINRLRRII